MPSGEKQYKFEEILPIYKNVSGEAEAGTFADFMEAFKTFDREGQGSIAAAELRLVLSNLGLVQFRKIFKSQISNLSVSVANISKFDNILSLLNGIIIKQQLIMLTFNSFYECLNNWEFFNSRRKVDWFRRRTHHQIHRDGGRYRRQHQIRRYFLNQIFKTIE